MKVKHILMGAGLSLCVALGVGAGLSFANAAKDVAPVEAAATSHQLIVKFGGMGNWTDANAKLAVYVWKGSGDNKVDAWTNTLSLSTTQKIYKLDYSFDGNPDNMIISRQSSSAGSTGTWGTSWAQSADLSFNEATYIDISGWDINSTSGWTLSAQVRSSAVTSFGTKQTLSTIGINGSGNPEVSGLVTLAKDEEFKILSGDGVWSGYYGCPELIDDYISGGSKDGVDNTNPNIVCEEAGTYDFFFDTETKKLWITRQDIADADGYASYFLSNVGCDETGKTAPSGWATVSSSYSSLSSDAKAILVDASANKNGDNIARCVYWYDYAVRNHPGLTAFMTGRTVAGLNYNVSPLNVTTENFGMPIIVVVTVVLLAGAGVGGYFALKKRKEN